MAEKGFNDLTGVGKIVDSEIVKESYKDAVSPAMKEVGLLAEDTVKTFRLFTAPIQLLATYQDRFANFCDRVRNKVPDEFQQSAAANITKPVMEAFSTTEDDSPLMDMFEELMSKAIDSREASKLNPIFPELIKNLSPYQAKLIKNLKKSNQITDDLINDSENKIIKRLYSNFSFEDFGDHKHHLTLAQDLANKNIVNIRVINEKTFLYNYSDIKLDDDHRIQRRQYELTMFGIWFADSCIRD